MKPSVYIHATILNLMIADPSRDLIVAARQWLTHEWWERHRQRYDCYVDCLGSFLAPFGVNPELLARHLDLVKGFATLDDTDQVASLMMSLSDEARLSDGTHLSGVDANRVALAAVHRVDFLLTWDCARIANARLRRPIEAICQRSGYESPLICTPDQMMGVTGYGTGRGPSRDS